MRGLAGAFATRINVIIVTTTGHRRVHYNLPQNSTHSEDIWLIYLDLEHTRHYLSTTKILNTGPQFPPPTVSVANGNTARIRRVTGSTEKMHGMLRGREDSDSTSDDSASTPIFDDVEEDDIIFNEAARDGDTVTVRKMLSTAGAHSSINFHDTSGATEDEKEKAAAADGSQKTKQAKAGKSGSPSSSWKKRRVMK